MRRLEGYRRPESSQNETWAMGTPSWVGIELYGPHIHAQAGREVKPAELGSVGVKAC